MLKSAYQKIDGNLFKLMINNGASNLKENIEIVNNLNVFPIPDGDTGENMFLTLKGGVDSIINNNDNSLSNVSSIVANGMLLGARGNSGVILSQLFYGLSLGLTGLNEATLQQFINALNVGVKQAYSAVKNPVEGTILTVAREASEFINNKINDEIDFCSLFNDFLLKMKESLKHTPELLPVLKKAGVVDSGGAGLVYITEGFYNALNGEEKFLNDKTTNKTTNLDLSLFDENSEMVFGYCTELLLRLQKSKTNIETFDVNLLIDYLSTIGDSIVAFKIDSIVKIHIHTLTPYKVLEYCQKFGEYLTVKIENMTLQHNETINEKKEFEFKVKKERKKYAVVTVGSGNGLINMFYDLGCDYVINGGQTNNPSSKDFINAFDEVNADYIFVLPNNCNIILAAKQAAEIYKDSNIIVIESKSIGQGYSALSMFDFSCDNPKEIEKMLTNGLENVITGLVSKANRSTNVDNIVIEKDNYIGFTNKTILSSQKSKIDTLIDLTNKIDLSNKCFALLLYGKDTTEEEQKISQNLIKEKYPELELYTLFGEQEIYDFIIIIE